MQYPFAIARVLPDSFIDLGNGLEACTDEPESYHQTLTAAAGKLRSLSQSSPLVRRTILEWSTEDDRYVHLSEANAVSIYGGVRV